MDKKLIGSTATAFLLGAALAALWLGPRPLSPQPMAAAESSGKANRALPEDGPGTAGSARSQPAGGLEKKLAEIIEQPVAGEAEIERHLIARNRSRETLLAIGLLTHDDDLLREAAQRFPDDPHVQFLVVSKGLFPEQQREWVERFKASQPDNSLAAYFMAGE